MSALLPIQKGLPIPENPRGRKYPFMVMEVGDSFLVAGDPSTMKRRMNGSLTRFAHSDRKFVLRQVAEGVRIWRVK